jgi:hypothetical protein
MFWQVLESFSEKERSSFLQFAWARSRLPEDVSDRNRPVDQRSWRLQLNIIDANSLAGPKASRSMQAGGLITPSAIAAALALSAGHPVGGSAAAGAGGPAGEAAAASAAAAIASMLDTRLPSSETCFFNLSMPAYSSFEVTRRKLLLAMQTTSSKTDPTARALRLCTEWELLNSTPPMPVCAMRCAVLSVVLCSHTLTESCRSVDCFHPPPSRGLPSRAPPSAGIFFFFF